MSTRSLLVFRNGSIGNTLIALPAIASLRKGFPEATITCVLDPVGDELIRFCPYIDRTVSYDKHGKDRGISAHLRLIEELRSYQPDRAILFKRFFRNGLLAKLSGAKKRFGFETDGSAPFLNYSIPYDESIHISELNLKLAELAGGKRADSIYELFLGEEDVVSAREQLAKMRLAPSSYLIVHYGGSTTGPDSVPPARMLELLRQIPQPILFIGAGERERSLAQGLSAALSNTHFCCDLPVRTMAALIQSAGAFLGFNSGPMHIAAALKTQGVAFFAPTPDVDRELVKWSPLGNTIHTHVPPAGSESAEWSGFVHEVANLLQSMLAESPR